MLVSTSTVASHIHFSWMDWRDELYFRRTELYNHVKPIAGKVPYRRDTI